MFTLRRINYIFSTRRNKITKYFNPQFFIDIDIKDLSIDEKIFIARMLNDRDSHGKLVLH